MNHTRHIAEPIIRKLEPKGRTMNNRRVRRSR